MLSLSDAIDPRFYSKELELSCRVPTALSFLELQIVLAPRSIQHASWLPPICLCTVRKTWTLPWRKV